MNFKASEVDICLRIGHFAQRRNSRKTAEKGLVAKFQQALRYLQKLMRLKADAPLRVALHVLDDPLHGLGGVPLGLQ